MAAQGRNVLRTLLALGVLSVGLILPVEPAGAVAPAPAALSSPSFASVQTAVTDPGLATILSADRYRLRYRDVMRLYRVFFSRDPDVTGAFYWMDVFDQTHDLGRISYWFSQSDEFRLRYGSQISDVDFVTNCYRNMMEREPDPGGLAYWLETLDRVPRHEIVMYMVLNDELIRKYPYSPIRSVMPPSMRYSYPSGWLEWFQELSVTKTPGGLDDFALDVPSRAALIEMTYWSVNSVFNLSFTYSAARPSTNVTAEMAGGFYLYVITFAPPNRPGIERAWRP